MGVISSNIKDMGSNLNVITDPLEVEKVELAKKLDQKVGYALVFAGLLFASAAAISSATTIFNVSHSSVWGTAWKTLAFAGLCSLGYQYKKVAEDRDSIRNAVQEMAVASQVNKDKPLVVFINYKDPPGLLPSLFYDVTYKEQVEKLSKIAQVHILEPIDELTLTNSLNHFKSKSIKTMCIRSHADELTMDIASPKLILSAKQTKILNTIRDKMTKDSHIILLGCCTAKGEENISKQISLVCPDSIVYGTTNFAHVAGGEINVDGSNKIIHFEIAATSEGTKVTKIENLTRKYSNGLIID